MPFKPTIVPPPIDPFAEREAFNLDDAWAQGLYMVEQWHPTKDEPAAFIYGTSNLDKARAKFAEMVRKRPGGRWIMRQKMRTILKYPDGEW